MAAGLDGTGLVNGDVARIDGNDRLVAAQHAVDDGGVGLRSANEEEHVGPVTLAGHPDFLLRTFAVDVEAVGECLLTVRFHEVLHHLRMGTVVVVAFE